MIETTDNNNPQLKLNLLSNSENMLGVILKMRDYKLQGTAYDKRCQRRIYKRSDQPKKYVYHFEA